MLTKDEVKGIIYSATVEEVAKAHTKSKLTEMYATVYNGLKPRTAMGKEDLVRDMRDYFNTEVRTKALLNM